MAEMNTNWRKINRTDYVQEHFCLSQFIQSDRWPESSPPKFTPQEYPYRKDGFEYSRSIHTCDNEIHVTEMTHATSFECMLSIINDGGFRATEKDYPGIGVMSLVWFGLKIEENQIDYVKENSKRRVQALMQDKPELKADNVLSKIAGTPAFQPMSLYGNFKFTIGIKEVLDAYTTQFCNSLGYQEIRKLGTLAYKQETMHAILVCPPDTPGTLNCPPLSLDPVIQPDATLETWTWKPHSTGNQYISFLDSGYPWFKDIRWEHVAFAFHVPQGSWLKIQNLESRVSLCMERSRNSTINGVNVVIENMLDFIASTEATKKKSLADMLISMIAGYLKEERMYAKTMESYFEAEYAQVNLEPVVQRIRELLPSVEFEELNWEPLSIWMKSLTSHGNVLRDILKAKIRL